MTQALYAHMNNKKKKKKKVVGLVSLLGQAGKLQQDLPKLSLFPSSTVLGTIQMVASAWAIINSLPTN
jgi:hypothetical protein